MDANLNKALEVIEELRKRLRGHKDVIRYQHDQLERARAETLALRVELDLCRKDRHYEVQT